MAPAGEREAFERPQRRGGDPVGDREIRVAPGDVDDFLDEVLGGLGVQGRSCSPVPGATACIRAIRSVEMQLSVGPGKRKIRVQLAGSKARSGCTARSILCRIGAISA